MERLKNIFIRELQKFIIANSKGLLMKIINQNFTECFVLAIQHYHAGLMKYRLHKGSSYVIHFILGLGPKTSLISIGAGTLPPKLGFKVWRNNPVKCASLAWLSDYVLVVMVESSNCKFVLWFIRYLFFHRRISHWKFSTMIYYSRF